MFWKIHVRVRIERNIFLYTNAIDNAAITGTVQGDGVEVVLIYSFYDVNFSIIGPVDTCLR